MVYRTMEDSTSTASGSRGNPVEVRRRLTITKIESKQPDAVEPVAGASTSGNNVAAEASVGSERSADTGDATSRQRRSATAIVSPAVGAWISQAAGGVAGFLRFISDVLSNERIQKIKSDTDGWKKAHEHVRTVLVLFKLLALGLLVTMIVSTCASFVGDWMSFTWLLDFLIRMTAFIRSLTYNDLPYILAVFVVVWAIFPSLLLILQLPIAGLLLLPYRHFESFFAIEYWQAASKHWQATLKDGLGGWVKAVPLQKTNATDERRPLQSEDSLSYLFEIMGLAVRMGVWGVSLSLAILGLHELAGFVLWGIKTYEELGVHDETYTRVASKFQSIFFFLCATYVIVSTLVMLLDAHQPLMHVFTSGTDAASSQTSERAAATVVEGSGDQASRQLLPPSPTVADRLRNRLTNENFKEHIVATTHQILVCAVVFVVMSLIESVPSAAGVIFDVAVIAHLYNIYMISLALLLDTILLRSRDMQQTNREGLHDANHRKVYLLYRTDDASYNVFRRLCVAAFAGSGLALSFTNSASCDDCFPVVTVGTGFGLVFFRAFIGYLISLHHETVVTFFVVSGTEPRDPQTDQKRDNDRPKVTGSQRPGYGFYRNMHLLLCFLVFDCALTLRTALFGPNAFVVDFTTITAAILGMMVRAGIFLLVLTLLLKWFGDRPEIDATTLKNVEYNLTLTALTSPGPSSHAILLGERMGRLRIKLAQLTQHEKAFYAMLVLTAIVGTMYARPIITKVADSSKDLKPTEIRALMNATSWSTMTKSNDANWGVPIDSVFARNGNTPNQTESFRKPKQFPRYPVCTVPFLASAGLDVVDVALMLDLSYSTQESMGSLRKVMDAMPFRAAPIKGAQDYPEAIDLNSDTKARLGATDGRVSLFYSANASSPESPNTLFVIFRGTHQLHEWVLDAKIWFSQAVSRLYLAQMPKGVPWPSLLTVEQITRLSYPLQPDVTLSETVREYFAHSEESLYELVERFLWHNSTNRVVVAGHSLGGGIAKYFTGKMNHRSFRRTRSQVPKRYDDRISFIAMNAPGLMQSRLSHQLTVQDLIFDGININTHVDPVSQVDSAQSTAQTIICSADSSVECHRLPYVICELWCACREKCPESCKRPTMSFSGGNFEVPAQHSREKLQQRIDELNSTLGIASGMPDMLDSSVSLTQEDSKTFGEAIRSFFNDPVAFIMANIINLVVVALVHMGVVRICASLYEQLDGGGANTGETTAANPTGLAKTGLPSIYMTTYGIACLQTLTSLLWMLLVMIVNPKGVCAYYPTHPSTQLGTESLVSRIGTASLNALSRLPLLGHVANPVSFQAPDFRFDAKLHVGYYIMMPIALILCALCWRTMCASIPLLWRNMWSSISQNWAVVWISQRWRDMWASSQIAMFKQRMEPVIQASSASVLGLMVCHRTICVFMGLTFLFVITALTSLISSFLLVVDCFCYLTYSRASIIASHLLATATSRYNRMIRASADRNTRVE